MSEGIQAAEVDAELSALEPITREIVDGPLRAEVMRLLTAEILARLSLRSIDLSTFEDPEYEAPDIDMWDTLAQPVRSALIALLELRKTIADFAPATEPSETKEVEVAFDLVPDGAPVEQARDTLGQQVDDWLQSTLEAPQPDAKKKTAAELRIQVQTSIEPLAGILVQETQRFASRLRNPNIVVSRWNLLSELQEFKGKFTKLLGALRVGLLHPFTTLPESELLGDYRTEEQSSVMLRASFILLERDINALIAIYQKANTEERSFVLEEVLVRLMRFCHADAFAVVRALDKRAIIEFRRALAQEVGKKVLQKRRVEELFEDFSKFLDMMHELNRREVLQKLDGRMLADLRARVAVVEEVSELDQESARKLLAEARTEAKVLFGRDPLLDVWLERELPIESRTDLKSMLQWIAHAISRL